MFSRFGRVARSQAKPFGRRNMAGHAAPPPEGGIDAFVYKYLPGNHQVAMAIIGLYAGLFLTYKLVSSVGGKKEPVKAIEAPAASSSGDIPGVDSPDFAAWVAAPGNVDKFFAELK